MMLLVAVSFLSGDLKSGANSGAKSARDLCSTTSDFTLDTLTPTMNGVLYHNSSETFAPVRNQMFPVLFTQCMLKAKHYSGHVI